VNNVSITYIIHNDDVAQPRRICQSVLTTCEETSFLTNGVVVPHQRLGQVGVDELRDAVDRLGTKRFPEPLAVGGDAEFAGQYLRDPHKQDPRILTVPLVDFPLADTARCLAGPRVLLRNSNIRRTQPGTGDATIWHTDYRPHTTPAPRLAAAPAVITMLVYLDPASVGTGPLFVVPGSHARAQQPPHTHDDLPDQVVLCVEPGQVVLMNAALWHRGGPNHSPDQVRRLVTLQVSSVYMSPFNFEPSLPSPAFLRLVEQARARRDEPLLELLGLGGVNPSSTGY
jgi:hypothetical protein